MAKHRYQFNPHTLSFDKIEFNLKEWLVKVVFTRFGTSFLVGVGIYLAFNFYFDSPLEKNLIKSQKQLIVNYNLMNANFRKMESRLAELQFRDDNLYRPVYEMTAIPEAIRKAGIGGVNRYINFEGFQSSDFLIQSLKESDRISKQVYIQSKSFDEVYKEAKGKAKMIASIPAIQPISNKSLTGFGPFGMRLHPILHIFRLHAGVDLCAPGGTEIYAAGDGRVIEIKYNGGLGNYVKISHGYGYVTVYGHASKILVRQGQRVKRGEVIALVGTTGLSQVNHLHYEVHKHGAPVDPISYYVDDLTEEEYQKMVNSVMEKPASHFD